MRQLSNTYFHKLPAIGEIKRWYCRARALNFHSVVSNTCLTSTGSSGHGRGQGNKKREKHESTKVTVAAESVTGATRRRKRGRRNA